MFGELQEYFDVTPLTATEGGEPDARRLSDAASHREFPGQAAAEGLRADHGSGRARRDPPLPRPNRHWRRPARRPRPRDLRSKPRPPCNARRLRQRRAGGPRVDRLATLSIWRGRSRHVATNGRSGAGRCSGIRHVPAGVVSPRPIGFGWSSWPIRRPRSRPAWRPPSSNWTIPRRKPCWSSRASSIARPIPIPASCSCSRARARNTPACCGNSWPTCRRSRPQQRKIDAVDVAAGLSDLGAIGVERSVAVGQRRVDHADFDAVGRRAGAGRACRARNCARCRGRP